MKTWNFVVKKLSLLVILFLLAQFCSVVAAAQNKTIADARDSDAFMREQTALTGAQQTDYSARVEALLNEMTLEEKVGQMTQLNIGMIGDGKGAHGFRINPTKLEKAVVTFGAGSILNANEEAFTVEQWHRVINQVQAAARRTRLKIPVLYGIDSIHGANYIREGTLFPQPLGMAATWNPALNQRAAEISAIETRAAGIPWNFSPVLDVGRQPLWSRFYETFGEDTYLTQVLGVATIRGYQGTDASRQTNVAACLKHYVGYSFPVSGRDRSSALIPENTLREIFLPPFRAAIDAGAMSVMINSGEVNGTPVHISKFLLTDVLRGEMRFTGVAVSDWEDLKRLVTTHHVAANEKEATRIAILAGVDMSMVPNDYSFSELLVQLVRENRVPMTRIDEAVRRILTMKFKLGLFAAATPDSSAGRRIATGESQSVALEAARESLTLLKNTNNALPLGKNQKILVTGATADSLVSLNNGWTYTWQGKNVALYPKDRLTIQAAVRAKTGNDNQIFVPGTDVDREIDIEKAVAAASRADAIVICLGEGSYTETLGNIDDLTLPEPQLRLAGRLIAAAKTANKKVILVLAEGRPRIINRIADNADAILMAYNPGNFGGEAIADVLFGDTNPSGRLPFTYPRFPNALLTYDYKIPFTEDEQTRRAAFNPQFEFGAGIGYTTFAYSDLKVDRPAINPNENITVSIKVANTGNRAGKEVVQLYLRDVVATTTPPVKRLKRFQKIALDKGQSQTLTFTLRPVDFSFVAADNKPVVEPGAFEVLIGGLTTSFEIR